MKKTRENQRRLYRMAADQQGLFTARQAREAGYSEKNHAYHLRSGEWRRVRRGIYRLADFPAAERPDLALWSLWSADRDGEAQGVFSHETALDLHDLSDLNPGRIHLTVPPAFRRNAPLPPGLVLHPGRLDLGDTEPFLGCRVTRPMKTLRDLLRAGTVPEELLTQALVQALRRGLVPVHALLKEELPGRMKEAAEAHLFEIRHGKAA